MNQYPVWIGLIVALLMASLAPHPLWWMVAFMGIAANGLVTGMNGWKMPVQGSREETIRHTPMITTTQFKWLGDVIPIGMGKASLGDFLICGGIMGVFATRDQFTYTKVIALLCFVWWGSGWVKGFSLLDKWTKEARRDCRKNIPIVLILMIIGNLLNVRGCSSGELRASVKDAKTAISPDTRKVEVKTTPQAWRSLGSIVGPSPQLLTRLRQEAEKQKRKELREKLVNTLVVNPLMSLSVNLKSVRKGPFCRVTCAAHHGGKYDVETSPDLCRANWIPPTAIFVPGWIAVSKDAEMSNPWPGPVTRGFDKYTLYWSELQGEAKVIHQSNGARTDH